MEQYAVVTRIYVNGLKTEKTHIYASLSMSGAQKSQVSWGYLQTNNLKEYNIVN